MEASVDAVILGGGSLKDSGVESAPEPLIIAGKALLKIGGREMIEYIIDALGGVKRIRRTIIIAPDSALNSSWAGRVGDVIPTVGSAVENAVAAINFLKDSDLGLSKYILFMTCDIPLITTEAINDFLDRCLASNDDVYYPVIRKEVIEAKYPETKRTYASLRDGTITGGNFALMEPEIILANLELLEDAYAARKSIVKVFRLLGAKFIVKYLAHALTIEDIEQRVNKIVNAKAKAIVTPYPEVGINVDKPADVELVTKVLTTA